MIVPKHKRFIYSYNSISGYGRVGVVTLWEMEEAIRKSGITRLLNSDTQEDLFERTFRYGSVFGKWLDTEWRT